MINLNQLKKLSDLGMNPILVGGTLVLKVIKQKILYLKIYKNVKHSLEIYVNN